MGLSDTLWLSELLAERKAPEGACMGGVNTAQAVLLARGVLPHLPISRLGQDIP